jgi:hypothetical protein
MYYTSLKIAFNQPQRLDRLTITINDVLCSRCFYLYFVMVIVVAKKGKEPVVPPKSARVSRLDTFQRKERAKLSATGWEFYFTVVET